MSRFHITSFNVFRDSTPSSVNSKPSSVTLNVNIRISQWVKKRVVVSGPSTESQEDNNQCDESEDAEKQDNDDLLRLGVRILATISRTNPGAETRKETKKNGNILTVWDLPLCQGVLSHRGPHLLGGNFFLQ